MNEVLQEFVDSRSVPLRVDRAAGMIRGVKLLGLSSRNGRRYLPTALVQAVGMYEGAKVNVNHPKGSPLAPRDYQERLGLIRNVAMRSGAGLFGDFHFNPKHVLAEQLLWDAEHAPENVGFSHNVEARISRQGEQTVVEAILKVQSVDLVADPATTRGLFESAAPGDATTSAPALPAEAHDLASLTCEQLERLRPDLAKAARAELLLEVETLRRQIDGLQASEAAERRRGAIRALLAEFKLPDPASGDPLARALVSEGFLQSLAAAADERAMRALVEERAQIVAGAARWSGSSGASRPQAREQSFAVGPREQPLDTSAFVKAIT